MRVELGGYRGEIDPLRSLLPVELCGGGAP